MRFALITSELLAPVSAVEKYVQGTKPATTAADCERARVHFERTAYSRSTLRYPRRHAHSSVPLYRRLRGQGPERVGRRTTPRTAHQMCRADSVHSAALESQQTRSGEILASNRTCIALWAAMW